MNELRPDIASRPAPRRFADEPTEMFPVLSPPPPTTPPPPPKVEARAVIVYEPEPRRPWALWVFTGMLVALTVGVILGQTSAYQEPRRRSVPAAQAEVLPTYQTPAAEPSPSTVPPTAQQITAPLGAAKDRVLEVTGDPTLLVIRSSELGTNLFTVTTLDGSVTPQVVDTADGPQLNLTRTGTEVYLNSAVRWTIRLAGKATEQQIDMRAGGLSGLELKGASDRVALDLPAPAGAVALQVTGAVKELRIRPGDVPVRLRLTKGAGTASIDGTPHERVKSGAVYASKGWKSAKNRYDIKASAKLGSVIVDRVL